MAARLAMLAAVVLALAPLAALAQPKGQLTYRCTSKDGRKYYGSTIPQQCYGQPVEQLNAQGLVVKRIDPEGEEKARLAKEAEAAKKREDDAAGKEAGRRNRALLATYTSEKDIDDARRRALADNQKAVTEVEMRIEALKKRRAGYEKELEFYKGKSKPPAVLEQNIRNAEIDLEAQAGLLAAKKKEVDGINARYDDDKKRYIELTRGSK